MNKPILYLVLGLPGAGKTTAAKLVSELTGAVYLSSDELRLKMFATPSFSQKEHDLLYEKLDQECQAILQQGKSVVYDANLNRYEHRRQKYELAKHTNADVVLFWLVVNRMLAKQRRIETQHPQLVPKHEVPERMFERIADVFEPPLASEPYIELDGTAITKAYISANLNPKT